MDAKLQEKILYKDLSYIIQGCCFDIRKEYGPGQKEVIYVNLLREYLENRGIVVEKEKSIKIYSLKSGKTVGTYKPDLLIDDKIIMEIKSSLISTKRDEKQLYYYLRNSKYDLGYLVNFSTPLLFIKRIVYSNYKKPFLKLLSCIFVLFFAWFSVIDAATLFFKPSSQEIKTGDYFQVDLYLNPSNEDINAVEGKIVIPENLLAVSEVLEGDSIVSLWMKRPTLEDGKIVFSGVIPGGFKGAIDPFKEGYQPGKILSLILKTKIDGQGFISIESAKTLLDDGQGTETKLSIINYQFSISQEAPTVTGLLPIKDPDPPELFEPTLARSPDIFDNQWFLVFVAQDKGSGIARYELQETENKQPEDAWIKAESPYLLKDQQLNSYVYVKAVDKAGNERVAVVFPQDNPRDAIFRYDNYYFRVILLLGVAAILLLLIFLWRKGFAKKITSRSGK